MRRDLLEAFDEGSEHGLAGVATTHGGWDREPRHPLGQPQHRGAVGSSDDLVTLGVTELGALVDSGRAHGDVGKPWAFRIVT
jgi:hypothetical protein